MKDIQENYTTVTGKIDHVCSRFETQTELIAVSKNNSVESVLQLINANHLTFGENRIQEAVSKFEGLREKHPNLKLHLIGPLQSNKVKEAVRLFDYIQTLDREKLAGKLSQEMEKQNKWPKCFIQVNTGNEPQKAGINIEETAEFAAKCRDQYGLPVVGLMCIPPVDESPVSHFSALRQLCNDLDLPYLSMGMSSDYESAIEQGATHVRVGSAIFGQRDYN